MNSNTDVTIVKGYIRVIAMLFQAAYYALKWRKYLTIFERRPAAGYELQADGATLCDVDSFGRVLHRSALAKRSEKALTQ